VLKLRVNVKEIATYRVAFQKIAALNVLKSAGK
jgi:hypothetical protein